MPLLEREALIVPCAAHRAADGSLVNALQLTCQFPTDEVESPQACLAPAMRAPTYLRMMLFHPRSQRPVSSAMRLVVRRSVVTRKHRYV